MEYCITVSATYTKGYTIEAEDDAAAEKYADALLHALSHHRHAEILEGSESWDYAVDQDGRDVVRWSE